MVVPMVQLPELGLPGEGSASYCHFWPIDISILQLKEIFWTSVCNPFYFMVVSAGHSEKRIKQLETNNQAMMWMLCEAFWYTICRFPLQLFGNRATLSLTETDVLGMFHAVKSELVIALVSMWSGNVVRVVLKKHGTTSIKMT